MSNLLEAGAEARLATDTWFANAYRWVVWKLSAYEQQYPTVLKGRMLKSSVVFDQLKIRYPCFYSMSSKIAKCQHLCSCSLSDIARPDPLAKLLGRYSV